MKSYLQYWMRAHGEDTADVHHTDVMGAIEEEHVGTYIVEEDA